MERGRKDGGDRPNAWHQKRGGSGGRGNGGGGFNSTHSSRGAATKKHGSTNKRQEGETVNTAQFNSIAKFEAAKSKLEEAVKKHMIADYESSDDEDDVQVDPILGKLLIDSDLHYSCRKLIT